MAGTKDESGGVSGGFAVLNPRGRDADQNFADGPGTPDDPGHAPVNYHAYAACLGGGFYRTVARIPESTRDVLVLLRKKNLRAVQEAIRVLQGRRCRAWISFKESGTHQLAEFLNDVTRLEVFLEIAGAADGYLASTSQAEELYRAAGMMSGAFVPTPYPVDVAGWDFGRPLEERNGIFVGTREFDVPTRRHTEALLIADILSRKLECPLAVVNPDGRRGGMLLKRIRRNNPLFFLIEGPLEYSMYLKLMASHRVVLQLDQSHVPGQVAGDALLARLPCVGGNGAVESLAFPELAGLGSAEAMARTEHLLTDDEAYGKAVADSQARGAELLSFAAGGARLRALFDRPRA